MNDGDISTSKQARILTLGMGGILAASIFLGAYLNYHAFKSVLFDLTRTRLQIVATDLQARSTNIFPHTPEFQNLIDQIKKSDPQIRSIEIFDISEYGATDQHPSSHAQTTPGTDNTMVVEVPLTPNSDQIAAIALNYSLATERLQLARKRNHLLIISLSGFALLTALSGFGIRWILRPARDLSRRMTHDFSSLLEDKRTIEQNTPPRWQEETDYLGFRENVRAILNVLEEAEDYGLTDPTSSGERA